jgi:hypothetical protein
MKTAFAFSMLAIVPIVCAQELKLSAFDRLKPLASNVVDLNLSKDLLGLATGFLGGEKGDGARIKKLAEGLNNVVIRSFEFDKEGVYSDADVKQLIAEMSSAGWKLVVSAYDKKERETSRIWLKATGNGELGGMRILSAEPKELSVIEITGKIRLEDLKDLGGLGIPDIPTDHTGQPSKKDEE